VRAVGFLVLLLAACGAESGKGEIAVPGREGASKTVAALRAQRRLFDGAPPVIPHVDFGSTCTTCHNETGMAVPNVGFAPPMPHVATKGMSAISNCRQCHVEQRADEPFRETNFVGLRQDLRRGKRLFEGAPPVLPHPIFMRENCLACHTGPAAREEIRCDHPERARCTQCHLERHTTETFSR